MEIFDLQTLLNFLQDYTSLACFLSAFWGGTSLTLVLSSISGQGIIPFWKVFTFCFLGNLVSDLLWFLAGRTALMARITDSRYLSKGYEKISRILAKYKKKELFIFIIVKFVYGIRILTILLYGRNRYVLNKFLAYNTTAVLIITVAVTFTGWMAGRGVGLFLDIFQNLKTATASLIVLLVLMHFIKKPGPCNLCCNKIFFITRILCV